MLPTCMQVSCAVVISYISYRLCHSERNYYTYHILTVVAIDNSLKAIQHCGHEGRREKLCKSIQGGILKNALHNTVAAGVNGF